MVPVDVAHVDPRADDVAEAHPGVGEPALEESISNLENGIWPTLSANGLVKKNVAYGSEDSALWIEAHPSAASLPPLGDDGNWDIVGNYVHDNNEPNEAPRGSMSADLPPGGGILVLGVDRVNIQKNRIERDNFYGISPGFAGSTTMPCF